MGVSSSSLLLVFFFSLLAGVSSFSLLAMLDQTVSLGSAPALGSKRLLACSAMISRSLTRAVQSGWDLKKLAKRGSLLMEPPPDSKSSGRYSSNSAGVILSRLAEARSFIVRAPSRLRARRRYRQVEGPET